MLSVIHVVYTFCFIICVTDGLQQGKDDTSLWLNPTTCQNLHLVLLSLINKLINKGR